MRAEDIPFLKPRRPLMVALTALWIPILLSAVIVFVASSIIHMVLPYHRSDYKKLPDEDKVTAALRSAGVTRGMYVFPYCTHKEMKSGKTYMPRVTPAERSAACMFSPIAHTKK